MTLTIGDIVARCAHVDEKDEHEDIIVKVFNREVPFDFPDGTRTNIRGLGVCRSCYDLFKRGLLQPEKAVVSYMKWTRDKSGKPMVDA